MNIVTIADKIRERALGDPDRLCIVTETDAMTYAQVWQESLRHAGALSALGLKKGDRVMVRCTQDAFFLIMDFACQLSGIVFVPFENEASAERIMDIAAETAPSLCIGEDLPAPLALDCPQMSREALQGYAAQAADESAHVPASDDTAQILYTTGTTGKSKGIEITHANNIALAENISEGVGMQPGNVEFLPLPLSHSHGLRCCYANFHSGGTVILTDGMRNPKQIRRLITEYHATAMDLSPTAARVILTLFKKFIPTLNEQLAYIQIGTAALSEELKCQLKAAFPGVRLYNFYGSTESGRSCVLNFNSDDDRKYCVGRPTVHAHFIITDDDRHEIASDENHTGLLACAGAMNMRGYWHQPELTKSIMKDGYIFTNDEAYIDSRGFVFVLGRKDDIINYMGIKIAPEEIEEVAGRFPGVADCVCVPRPDATAGQIPCLFVEAADPASFDMDAFTQYLAASIDSNKLPKLTQMIDKVPRTSNGKIQRKKLEVTS